MAQEAISEVDMDVFSRRIAPYFTWLESRIESGWEQTGSDKDILKEAKHLATTMRARFILGVSVEEFHEEIKRVVALFESAAEAFPHEGDEIDAKLKHLCKGISEELGMNFLPSDYQSQSASIDASKREAPAPVQDAEDSKEAREESTPSEPDVAPEPPKAAPAKPKARKKKARVETEDKTATAVSKPAKKTKTKKTKKTAKKKTAKKTKKKTVKSKPASEPDAKQTAPADTPTPKTETKPAKPKRQPLLVRWAKYLIYGKE